MVQLPRRVDVGELAQRDAGEAVEVAAFAQQGELAIDLAHEHVHRLEQQDGAIEWRQGPAGAGGDHVEIAADQPAFGRAAIAEGGGRFGGEGSRRGPAWRRRGAS